MIGSETNVSKLDGSDEVELFSRFLVEFLNNFIEKNKNLSKEELEQDEDGRVTMRDDIMFSFIAQFVAKSLMWSCSVFGVPEEMKQGVIEKILEHIKDGKLKTVTKETIE